MSDKKLPPKLEEDLNNAKFYKLSGANQENSAQKMAKVFDDSKERAMYDEILGPMMGANRKPVSTASSVVKPVAVSGGGDFNSSIIARLKQVEVDAKEARMKLAEQISINEKLRQENETLRALTTSPDTAMKETRELRQQVTQLKVKLQEMEVFLGDYGLVWVGSNPSKSYITEVDQEGHSEDRENGDNTDVMHIVSFADFNRQIDELNSVIYAEPAQIKKEGNNQRKARLVQSSELLESIRIVFYKNGLMIKRGPFRYCNASNYERFVHDIMDGYFPSEFQDEYPDGVVFDLKDQHSVVYIAGKTLDNFDQPQLSRAQFLNRLPKTVIHKGEVVGVRGEIAELLDGNSTPDIISLVKPKVFIDSTTTSGNKTPLEDMGDMVKIQVKWTDQSTFIIHLYEKQLVEDLKFAILQHFTGESNSVTYEFELRSAFPPRVLPWNITLKDAGLTPNGTVHARKLE